MKIIIAYFATFSVLWATDSIRQQLENEEVLGRGLPLMAKDAYTDKEKANGGMITYGAEKEGFDYRIVNVAGPNASVFKEYVFWLDKTALIPFTGSPNRKKFLSKLLHGMFNKTGSKSYLVNHPVVDIDGNDKSFDISEFQGKDYLNMGVKELWEHFTKWVDQTSDSPFSFIKPEILRQIIRAKFIKSSSSGRNNVVYWMEGWFKSWVPHFGTPQKYIGEVGPARHVDFRYWGYPRGWEINFIKQDSYGDFRGMINWFKKVMNQQEPQPENGKESLYQAPGHQRVVFPLKKFRPTKDGTPSAKETEYMEKIAEYFRLAQSLIVLRGIRGNTGIGTSKFKEVQSDEELKSLYTDRGVLRLELGRWGEDTMGVELRAGTKDDPLASTIIKSLTQRVAADNWSGINAISKYELINPALLNLNSWDPVAFSFAVGQLIKNTGVDVGTAWRFLKTVKNLKNEKGRSYKLSFIVFMWNWADAPFLTKQKKAFLKELTKKTVENIAGRYGGVNFEQFEDLLQSWARASKLDVDIINRLMPPFHKITENNIRVGSTGDVDVNTIDLGIEFSTRYHLEPIYLKEKVEETDSKEWMETRVDLTLKERKKVILNLAKEMSKNLNGEPPVVETIEGAHGHGLSLAVSFRDNEGRKWKLEWDGIGRDYDEKGNIIPGSPRGGHIEIVTPKFIPTAKELNAVMKSFKKKGHYPKHNRGGGHHNIDLAPFIGNPQKMARFVALTQRYMPVMSALFQSLERHNAAKLIKIPDSFYKKLLNHKWTESELKQELYNSGFFNPERGRKTRYVYLDMSAYYQDVIPAKYITEDYDFKSPVETYHKQFRVDPKIRKMEFRMFNAPMEPREVGLSIKLVRALLNKALNESDKPQGMLSDFSPIDYIKNPLQAHADLKTMTDELNLPFEDYKLQMNMALTEGKYIMRGKFFTSPESLELSKPADWEDAEEERSPENALSSEDHKWDHDLLPPEEEDLKDTQKKISAAKAVNQIRLLHEISQLGHRVVCLERNSENIPSFLYQYEDAFEGHH